MTAVAQQAQSLNLIPEGSAPSFEQILKLQRAMLPICSPLPEPEHIFHPGWYERRLLVPAGMLIVGKIHRHRHVVGVIHGHALLLSQYGRNEVRGGFLDVSEPGVKRIVLAFEDTLFVTLHRNEAETRDLALIEAEHIQAESLPLAQGKPMEELQ